MMTRCHCRYASWEVVRRGAPAVLYTLRRAAVGSVHHVPATSVGVRVLVYNGASGSPRSFGTPVGKVRLRHLREKKKFKPLRVLGIGISKGWVKIDTASGNSRKMHTNRLADKETLVGTSDDHGVIAGALLQVIVHGMLLTGQVYMRVWFKTALVTKGIPRLIAISPSGMCGLRGAAVCLQFVQVIGPECGRRLASLLVLGMSKTG